MKSPVKILRVDLTHQSIEIEEFPEELYRLYPGGKGLAGYILLRELPAHTEPFSPENILIIANGMLTGSPLSTATRYIVSARSPLTGGYGESEAAGFWGPELKMAGFEAIVIKGKAQQPVYLWIQDGQVEIRPAEHLWGHHPVDVQAKIREEAGDDKVRVLQIGVAGENLVRYASLTNDLRHFNGRNGMGAVMGSKNLKAVAVRGHQRVHTMAANTPALLELGKKFSQEAQKHPLGYDLYQRGTLGAVEGLNATGILPTNNFRKGTFDGVDNIKWDAYEKKILTARRSCYACAVRCKREVQIDGKVSEYGGPEFETVAAFGSDCGVDDLVIIAKANELCNHYLLDSISTGAAIAFAMECFEHGLISLADTDGLELRFGNAEVILPMVEKIAYRKGIGKLLAEGTKRAAEVIGGDAPFFTIEVKGQELAMHDPRGKYFVALGYAISEIGADHLVVPHDPLLQNPESVSFKSAAAFGITDAQPARSLSKEKIRQFFIFEQWVSMEKCVGWCFFGPAPRSFIQPEDVLSALKAFSGWDITMEEVLQMGERATNMARIFNLREGFSSKDDTLPPRMFTGLENGALAGQPIPKEEFEQAILQLYTLKGWDHATGKPTRQKIKELQLDWAQPMLDEFID